MLAKEPTRRVIYAFGPFQLNPAERRLVRDGRELRLSPKVFETLVLLVERRGLLLEKDELMKLLWPGTFVEEVTLARNISHLRKALGDTPGQDDSQYIATVSKRGYRFIAPVTEISSGDQRDAATGTIAPVPRKLWARPALWIALAVVLPLLGIVAFRSYRALHHPLAPISSLAVLPLENLSRDPDQEYFADGMTDELITNLAQIHSLRVISRTSVMQFKHTNKSLSEIAAALHVDAVVEGSVTRSGNKVHITAQLLDARQERHLWAASYEREINDVLGLQSEVATAIADQVKANITPQEAATLTRRRPINPDSYNAFLQARFLRYRDIGNTSQALPFLLQAVAIDPNNAAAWAELADSYAHMGADWGNRNPAEMRPLAAEAVGKALQIDPDLADAYTASAWIKMWYDWDWPGAERDLKRSIELRPNNATAHRYYARFFSVHKRFDEALKENRLAIDLDPLDISPQFQLAWVYADARMGDEAIAQCKRMLEIDPAHTGIYILLGRGYDLNRQWPAALAAYEKLEDAHKGAYWSGVMHVSAVTGNRRRADEIFAEIEEASKHRYISPIFFAEYYADVQDNERAIQWLETAYRERSPSLIDLQVNYLYDGLRSDPRFQDLERRVGFR